MNEGVLILLGIAGALIGVLITACVALIINRNSKPDGPNVADPHLTQSGSVSQQAWENYFQNHVVAPMAASFAATQKELSVFMQEVRTELRAGFADMKGAAADTKNVLTSTLEETRTATGLLRSTVEALRSAVDELAAIRKNGGDDSGSMKKHDS